MRRTAVAFFLSTILSLSFTAAPARPPSGIAGAGDPGLTSDGLFTPTPCTACAARTPILDGGRPPLPGEAGDGVASCTLIQTAADWAQFCDDNVVPGCPALDDALFQSHTVVAVVVDTVTPRGCEGSPDPLWKLECVQVTAAVAVRTIKQRPGGLCHCSAMPQYPQRLFLASAIPKTRIEHCRACEERQTVGCLP